jgi:hypothetical protein
VRLTAVLAVDDQAPHAPWFEEGFERVDVLQVFDQIAPFVVGERLVDVVVVAELGGRVCRVTREGILRRVVSHTPTLDP